MYIKRAEYVEVPIPTGNTKQQIYFPDLPNLKNTKLWGAEVYDVTTQAVAESGNAVPTQAEILNTIVVLQFDGGDFIKMPAFALFTNDGAAYSNQPREFAGQVINWPKSYLFFTTAAVAASVAGKSFLFNVYYSKQ